MAHPLLAAYDRLILARPWLCIAFIGLLVAGFATQLGKIKLDASADSLMLQGDPALDYFREIGSKYSAEEFLLITWQPHAGLLEEASLRPLQAMANELRALDGVASVVTVLDVPLLESPPLKLTDITSGDPLPTLSQPGIDREMALRELTTSPIYADLLASRDGEVSAVQINLQRDEVHDRLLAQREALRRTRASSGLTSLQRVELQRVEQDYKQHTAGALEEHARLVEQVRAIAARYGEHADLFVGGVPMIAADMVGFVRSDLVLFGTAIMGLMMVVMAIIFRRLRWVMIPLLSCSATLVVMLGLLGALDWRMTVISSNFVAVLLIITLALNIHLIVRYRELHLGNPEGSLEQRVRDTVRLMAVPCIYTAITTVVAFVSLVVSGIQPVIDFGWMMTVGITIAVSMVFLLVPCLMLVWPGAVGPPAHSEHVPLTQKFAAIADRFGTAILIASALLLAGVVFGMSKLEVENRFIDYFRESTEIYQGMELLDAKLGGTIPLDIILDAPDNQQPLPGLAPGAASSSPEPVADDDPFAEDTQGFEFAAGDDPEPVIDDEWADDVDVGFGSPGGTDTEFEPSYWFSLEGMRELDTIHAYVDSLPETGKVLSLSTTFSVVKDLLGSDIGGVELALVQRSLPPAIKAMTVDPYFAADADQARITIRVRETSRELRRNVFLVDLRQHLVDELGVSPDQLHFTGMLVLYNNVLQSLFRSQILTIGVVFLAILVMFLLLFRSLSLALIALAPNLLAAGLVLGVMGIAGIPLDIMTITIAAIVLGIGVDNCIHYVHRFMREFPSDRDYLATMYRCHGSIGRALYYTSLTVVVGFSTLTLSNFKPSVYFGMLTVLAMVAAVLGALLLLPRLIILFKPLGPEAR